MSINKKDDWVEGKWAFSLKIFTPEGGTMEYDRRMVDPREGRSLWEHLGTILGIYKPQPCCERDHDGDCDKHPKDPHGWGPNTSCNLAGCPLCEPKTEEEPEHPPGICRFCGAAASCRSGTICRNCSGIEYGDG